MQLISYEQPKLALSSLALDVHTTKQRHSACSEPGRSELGQRDAGQENREGNQTHPYVPSSNFSFLPGSTSYMENLLLQQLTTANAAVLTSSSS
jgi:hypothetical protein